MDIQLSDEVSQAYLAEVEDILNNKEFLSLSLYEHHQWTTRFMHACEEIGLRCKGSCKSRTFT